MVRDPISRPQSGFTLVEVMVAMAILLVGVLGTVTLIDGANAATSSNQAREGGTDLARELVEDARGIPYHELTSALLAPRLQARPGLEDADSAVAGWQIERRDRTYTVTASVCALDDPKDRSGVHPSGFCTDTGAADSSGADTDPEDYKRLTVELRWARGTGARLVRQTGLVGSPGQGGGVRVTSLTPSVTGAVTGTAPVSFTVGTTRAASRVEWAVDGVDAGQATGSGQSWTFPWAVSGLPDGTYLVSAEAFDEFNRSAGSRIVTMAISRAAPQKVINLRGEWSGADVVLTWDASGEGDVVGYTVSRIDAGGEIVVSGCDAIADTRCTSTPPGGAGTSYVVRALDRDASGAARAGTRSDAFDVGPKPGTAAVNVAPNAPVPLVKKVTGQRVALSWSAATDPDAGDRVVAYRIYRDGTLHASVTGAELNYTDANAGRVARTYRVTAVDTNGAESLPALES